MKLTNREVSRLWAALAALDGEKETEKSPAVRYEFKGAVLYAVARTINHLRGHQVVIEKTTEGIIRRFSGSEGIAHSDPKWPECQAELEQLLAAEVEVEVHRVKLEDLNLDKNHLRPGTLAGLAPIIEG
jgi:hypothetical protein